MGKLNISGLLIALFIGLTGIIGVSYLSNQVSDRLISQDYIKLEGSAKQIAIQFQDAIDVSVNDLEALQAFYSAKKGTSTQAEFNQYMAILDIENRHYIQALSWVPLVYDDERIAFETRIQAEQTDFSIKERGEEGLVVSRSKSFYTPVTFISPYTANQAAQGFDLSSNDTRRVSLLAAKGSGKMTATARIRLVQETATSYGVLIIAPVYQTSIDLGMEHPTKLAVNNPPLKGYVTGVFRIDTLIQTAYQRATQAGLTLTLMDQERDEVSVLFGQVQQDALFHYDLDVPGRRWQLSLTLSDALKNHIESPAIGQWILLGGGLISLLLALSFYALLESWRRARRISSLSETLQQQNEKLEQTVLQRTQAISEKNAMLNSHVERLESQKSELSKLMTESDNAKRKAQRLAHELARSNRDLDEFAYIASHDLKAPLRGIRQLIQWMEEDITSEKYDEVPSMLQLIWNRVGRLETLLTDLLTYAKVNQQACQLERVDAGQMFQELFPLYAPATGFSLDIQDPLPCFETDKTPFELVVRNLLNNAIKHHDKTTGVIQIRCVEREDYYTFMVKDDGPGIEPDYYDDIFKMFKTLKSRDEVEGSGMGLALIKKVVEFHHGSVHLESELGEGCAFYFTWPKHLSSLSETKRDAKSPA